METDYNIPHNFNPKFYYEKFAPWARSFLNRFFGKDGIKYSDLEKIKALGDDVNIVFTPNHRSHVDYFLLPWIFYVEGIKAPAIAAGDNLLGIPFFGKILRQGKAYRIERNPKNKEEFKMALTDYNVELLKDEENIIIFPEKGRSYSGKFKRFSSSSIEVIIDAANKANKNVYFVSVNISYERIIDDLPLLEKYKYKRTFINNFLYYLRDWPYIYATSFREEPKIRVAVNFGEPVSLEKFKEEYGTENLELKIVNYLENESKKLQEVHDTQLTSYTIRDQSPIKDEKLLENIGHNLNILKVKGSKISNLSKDEYRIWERAQGILNCFRLSKKGLIYTLKPKRVALNAATIEHLF